MAHVLVLGGDEVGRYHAVQLTKALGPAAVEVAPAAAAAEALARFLSSAARTDAVVPHPLMPHLLWEWLATELDASPAPAPRGWGLPFEAPGRSGEVYLSAAGWRCPAACVEPAHCPVLHAPRDWSLADIIEARALDLGYAAAVFRVLQLAGGIAAVPVAELIAARALRGRRVLVATSSHCHAAVGVLEPEGQRRSELD
jgi:hypothetical protein